MVVCLDDGTHNFTFFFFLLYFSGGSRTTNKFTDHRPQFGSSFLSFNFELYSAVVRHWAHFFVENDEMTRKKKTKKTLGDDVLLDWLFKKLWRNSHWFHFQGPGKMTKQFRFSPEQPQWESTFKKKNEIDAIEFGQGSCTYLFYFRYIFKKKVPPGKRFTSP
jgi:hypothetical protein